MKQKLLPHSIRKTIPPLYAQDGQAQVCLAPGSATHLSTFSVLRFSLPTASTRFRQSRVST